MWFWLIAIGLLAICLLGWSLVIRRPGTDSTFAVRPDVTDPSVNDVLDELHLGIAISGRDGIGAFRNAAAEAMVGTDAGGPLDDAIGRLLGRGLVGIRSDELVELDGPPRVAFAVRSSPLPGGGSVAFVEDVSERRLIDQVRTDFVANVSHELRTPIGVLSALAETLQGETDPATIDRFARRMLEESERAGNTIDDLIELSRVELGGEVLFEPVRAGDVVSGAIDRVRELAAQNDITISALDPVDAGGRRSDVVIIDGVRRQLVSAVGNLVENAVKYSEPGDSVQVRVRVGDGTVGIAVIDQGVGIPANDVDRVFERFYRVDQARSRATGGTGLGLSIVRHVATFHGGNVDVVSAEGEGSTFTLHLPLAVERPVGTDATRHAGVVEHDGTDDTDDPSVDEGVA